MAADEQLWAASVTSALPGRSGLSEDAALLAGAAQGGVYSLDQRGHATLVNDGAARLLGWTPADLVGRRLHDVIHHTRPGGAQYPIEECPVYRTILDGRPRRGESEVFWRKDGTRVPVEINCHPIHRAGGVAGVLVAFRDLSEQHLVEERARQLVQEQAARARAEFQYAHLRDALAQAPALICVTRGPHHVIESTNAMYAQATGRGDLVGRTVAESFPSSPPALLETLDLAYRSGSPVTGQEAAHAPLLTAGAGRRLYNFVVQPFRDEGGTVYGLMVHAVDVTEQVRARRDLLAQNRMLALMARVGLVLTGGEALRVTLQACVEEIVEHAGAAFARIWTLDTVNQVLELEASAGLDTHPDGPHSRIEIGRDTIGMIAQERKPHLSNDVPGDPQVGDHEWACREGLVAFAGYPLLVGPDLVGVLAMFARHRLSDMDVQALGAIANAISVAILRKRNEDALRVSEQALRRRANELAGLAAALERSNRELDAFAYAASHDLRAPLRGIANLSQWLEEDLQGHLSDETRQMLVLMRSRMHRMEGLVEGLLLYSRAGRTPHEPEAVDTGELVREIVDLLAPPATTTIDAAADLPVIRTARPPLAQVLMNLIGNAIKHAAGDAAVITVTAREDRDFYEFSVTDNGPGIDPRFHGRIWGIFQTLEARDTVEGTGIGLALVKKLTEAQGGQAWVESAPGAGATFKFLWRTSPAE